MPNKKNSYTLIEVLVAILILGVALSAVIPFSYKEYNRMCFKKACAYIDGAVRQKRLEALIQGKDLPLQISFKGEMIFNKENVEIITFIFYSNGSVEPSGSLVLKRGAHVSLLEIT
ncbi:MAG: type II secretion system protein [Chlamydiae bacterium]|nr:type II secretion system protein [Chlamydiota bacterium]